MDTSTSLVKYPEYLNADFFAKTLSNSLQKTDIKIKDINLSVGSNPGENYMSFIYRAIISYTDGKSEENKSVSLIIKSMPTDGDRAFMEEYDILNREVDIYMKVLSQMHDLLTDGSKLAPRCFYSTTVPVWTIVFEDLKPLGYSLADRQIGLDEEHCKLALQKIAQFHASSISVIQKNPFILETYRNCLLSASEIDSNLLEPFFHRNLKRGAEMVMDMPGYEYFAPILMDLYDNFKTKAVDCAKYQDNNLNVLNHGDLWVNNIMFKYEPDNQIPTDVAFVDFQMCHVNSLALDINYFFVNSSQLHVLKRKEEFVEKYYYPTFKQTLESIKFEPVPSLADILREMRAREMFALFNMFGELPLLLLDKDANVSNNYGSFSDETIASKTRNAGMAKQRFIDTMLHVLRYCEKLGLFENKL